MFSGLVSVIEYQVTPTAIQYFLLDAHMVLSLIMPDGLWTDVQEEFSDTKNSRGEKLTLKKLLIFASKTSGNRSSESGMAKFRLLITLLHLLKMFLANILTALYLSPSTSCSAFILFNRLTYLYFKDISGLPAKKNQQGKSR